MERLNPPTNSPEAESTPAAEAPIPDDYTRPPLESYEFSRHSKPESLAQEIVADSFKLLDREQAKEVLRAYRKHGEAFAAFLTLEDTNLADPEISLNFDEAYYGDQPLFSDMAEEYAEDQGWISSYDDFIRSTDIPEGVLVLDFERIRNVLDAMYDVVELEDARYLFNK